MIVYHVAVETAGDYVTRREPYRRVHLDRLMALGHLPGEPADAAFNMAVMGLRLASAANGVSRLHGAVSRAMFRDLWPDLEVDEVPIGSVTNGVHPASWVSPEMSDLLTRSLLPAWTDGDDATWARGRGWALSVALIALPYYEQTNPVMVANARRRVVEVLADF